MKNNHQSKNNLKKEKLKGFTLIELLVVIAIIALLSSIVMASLASARNKAKDAALLQEVKQFQLAMELYKSDNGVYPLQEDALPLGTWSNWYYLYDSQYTEYDPSAFLTSLSIVLIPKYISSIEGIFKNAPSQEFHNGFLSVFYYVSKPASAEALYPYGLDECGGRAISDDQYVLAILKPDYQVERIINLPFETWGYADGEYYCVTP